MNEGQKLSASQLRFSLLGGSTLHSAPRASYISWAVYRLLVFIGTLYVFVSWRFYSKYSRPKYKCANILTRSSFSEQAVCSAGRLHHSSSKAHPYRGQPGSRVPPWEHGAGSVPGHDGFVPSKSCGNASEGEKYRWLARLCVALRDRMYLA